MLDAQTWEIIEGDPLIIGVGSTGGVALWVCHPSGIKYQYFSEDSWRSLVWLNGADTSNAFYTGYTARGTRATAVSLTRPDAETIVATLNLGSKAQLKMIVSYEDGSLSYKKRFELTNTTAATFTDVRLMHGGDAYFGGVDSARSWWDATSGRLNLSNNGFSNSGTISFFGAVVTPANHYFGGLFSTGNMQANSGRLGDEANASYVDAGYYLEWDKASLAAGQTWVVESYEQVTHPSYLQVLPVPEQFAEPGEDVTLNFLVQNLDNTAHTFSLSAAANPAWTTALPNGNSITLASLERVIVPVVVSVPGSAPESAASQVSLTATESGAAVSSTGTSDVTVYIADYSLSASSLDFGTVVIGSPSPTRTLTFSNAGSALEVGAVGVPDAVDAPYTITADTCSGNVIATNGSCSVTIQYQPMTPAAHPDTFSFPLLFPVADAESIALSGTGIQNAVDLGVIFDADPLAAEAGTSIAYTVTASNSGPELEYAAQLVAGFPAGVSACTWTSAASGGASGNSASGSGDINETLELPAGASVTYSTTCTASTTGVALGNATIAGLGADSQASNNSASASVDIFEDGVDGGVEDGAPNGGDGNYDGIPDSLQPGVVSIPLGGQYVTMEVGGACSQAERVAETGEAALAPDPLWDYPYGLISFELPCSSATVKFFYHGMTMFEPGMAYRKYGPTPPDFSAPSWYSVDATFVEESVGAGATVWTASLNLVDGALGDNTGVDGRIVDPGGVGVRLPAAAPVPAAGQAQVIPVMGLPALGLLAGLLALLAIRGGNKRGQSPF
ncbi:choice-of-anchor U domain-containing protein [Haliea sp. E17]|uniref:choice-of-anchor U domain-containing protein n=1 Tax=Haliea sp. E17 TaxID=3401576 RepID=UPI003AAFCECE